MRDINSVEWAEKYKKQGIEWDVSPISDKEKRERITRANWYASFFFKQYSLMLGKYLKPEYSYAILYNKFPIGEYGNDFTGDPAPFTDFSKAVSGIDSSNHSSVLPMYEYYHAVNRDFYDNFVKESTLYINWIFDWEKANGSLPYHRDEKWNKIVLNRKDAETYYLENVQYLLKWRLITKEDQCLLWNGYVFDGDYSRSKIIQDGMWLDFFARGSRLGYYSDDWNSNPVCHWWDRYVDPNFVQFRNNYIKFFDSTYNTYSKPNYVYVDKDYGNYLNDGTGYKNNSNVEKVFGYSGKAPLVKVWTFGDNLPKSLFELHLWDFTRDETNPFHSRIWLTSLRMITNYLPEHYEVEGKVDKRLGYIRDPYQSDLYTYYINEREWLSSTTDSYIPSILNVDRIIPYGWKVNLPVISSNPNPPTIPISSETTTTTGSTTPPVSTETEPSITPENTWTLVINKYAEYSPLNQDFLNQFSPAQSISIIQEWEAFLSKKQWKEFSKYLAKKQNIFAQINKIIPAKILTNKDKIATIFRKLSERILPNLPNFRASYEKTSSVKSKNNYELLLIVYAWVVDGTSKIVK